MMNAKVIEQSFARSREQSHQDNLISSIPHILHVSFEWIPFIVNYGLILVYSDPKQRETQTLWMWDIV